MKLKKTLFLFTLLLGLLIVSFTILAKSKDGIPFEKATVDRVVDGDTIIANINGEKTRIRMIGINTPESVSNDASKNCKEGVVASDYTKAMLIKDMTIYLEYDKSRTDIYGRTLAYIWLTDNCDTTNYNDFCKYNYGAILLKNTYCESVYYAPNGKYKEWYDKLEKEYQPYNPNNNVTTTNNDKKETTKNVSIKLNTPKLTLTIKHKKVNVKFSKIKNAKKYKVEYSTNRKFKKAKSKIIKNNKLTIKNLKKNKKYYFRIRAINNNIYSKWSKMKSIKIK